MITAFDGRFPDHSERSSYPQSNYAGTNSGWVNVMDNGQWQTSNVFGGL
jgi:hypothetical protein